MSHCPLVPSLVKDYAKYFDFADVCGKTPNEKDRPSAKTKQSDRRPESNADFALQAARARVIAMCHECKFRRRLYSRKMFTVYQEEKIIDYLDSFIYTCDTEVPTEVI